MATIQRVLVTSQPQLGYGYKSITHDYMNDSLIDVTAIKAETFPILKPAKLSPEDVTIGDVYAKVPELYLHSVNYRHSIVENTSDINDVLNVKGSLAIKLSSVEGTLQGLYAKTSDKSTSSLNFVLSCEVITKIVKIDIKSLKMKPVPPATKEEDLYQQYGDSFISEVRYGGSMFASVSVILEDTDNKEDIKASISGVLNASSVKGKLDGSLDKKNYELIKNKRVEVTFSLKGGVISGPVPNTMEEFLKAAQDFPLSVGLYAPPYVIFVTPYKLVDPSVGMDYSNVLTTVEEVLSSNFIRLTGVSAQLNDLQQKMLDSPNVILTQQELNDFDGCMNNTQATMSKISDFLVSFQTQSTIPDFSSLFEDVSKLQLQAKALNRIFSKNYQVFGIHNNDLPPLYIDIVQSNLVLKAKKFNGSNQLWQFDTQGVITNTNNFAVLTVDKDNNVVAVIDPPQNEGPSVWSVQDLALLHHGTNKYLTAKDGKLIVAEKNADAKQQWCLRSASM